jgi:hypothetical protein
MFILHTLNDHCLLVSSTFAEGTTPGNGPVVERTLEGAFQEELPCIVFRVSDSTGVLLREPEERTEEEEERWE